MNVKAILAVFLIVGCSSDASRITASSTMDNLARESAGIKKAEGTATGEEGLSGVYSLKKSGSYQVNCMPRDLSKSFDTFSRDLGAGTMTCTQEGDRFACTFPGGARLEGYANKDGGFGLTGPATLKEGDNEFAATAVVRGTLKPGTSKLLYKSGGYVKEGDRSRFCMVATESEVERIADAPAQEDASLSLEGLRLSGKDQGRLALSQGTKIAESDDGAVTVTGSSTTPPLSVLLRIDAAGDGILSVNGVELPCDRLDFTHVPETDAERADFECGDREGDYARGSVVLPSRED